jgi:type II secretory pathway pseudopilin PulG
VVQSRRKNPRGECNGKPAEIPIVSRRAGTSIIETLVVIAIPGTLLGLFFPAVQRARRQALDVECMNNLRQLDIAIADYYESNKRLPGPGANGIVGGWTIEVLPFLEQKNMSDRVRAGSPIAAAPDFLLRQPRIFRCPSRSTGDGPAAGMMEPSSYVLVPGNGRKTFSVLDAPLDISIPWASGPEMTFADVVRRIGPHNRGFFCASGFQEGVGFVASRQDGP